MEGNQQKMRETLNDIVRIAKIALNVNCVGNNNNSEIWSIIDKCKSALSAPSRNCDFGTADEQLERFRQAWTNAKNVMIDRQSLMMLSEYARWSQQKYYEGDAE